MAYRRLDYQVYTTKSLLTEHCWTGVALIRLGEEQLYFEQNLTPALRDFIERFDDGYYPTLVETWVRSA